MSPVPERHALQPERTALAWQRTALVAVVLLVPLLVVGVRLAAWGIVLLLASGTIAGAVLLLDVHRRFAQLRDDSRGYSPFPMMLRVAVVTLLGAAGGTACALAVVLR